MESENSKTTSISFGAVIVLTAILGSALVVFLYQVYQAVTVLFIHESVPPPARSAFPEWTLSLPSTISRPVYVDLPGRWLKHGNWTMPHCVLRRNILPRSQVCYRLPELVVALNQSDHELAPFRIETGKTAADRVRPTLVVTCDEGIATVAININNNHRRVDWWPSLPLHWTTDVSEGSAEWEYKANSHGSGVWTAPNSSSLFQHLAHSDQLQLQLSPPNEQQVTVRFNLSGIDHINSLMHEHCPQTNVEG